MSVTVYIDGKPREFPDKIEQLSVDDIALYVKEFLLQRDQIFSQNDAGEFKVKNPDLLKSAQLKMLKQLLKISYHQFTRMHSSWKMDLIERERLLDFLFTDHITHPILHKVRYRGRVYLPPKDKFLIATEEFSFADAAYMSYYKTHQKKYLDILFAVIYRPADPWHIFRKLMPGYNGERRHAFNKHLLEKRIEDQVRISESVKLTLYFWYHLFRTSLPKDYSNVFTSSNQAKAKSDGWLQVILGMASEGPFGDYDRVCKTQIHLVLKELDRKSENLKQLRNVQ